MTEEKKKRFASRADFFGLEGLPFEDVPTPEFGPEVVARVKGLDGLRGHQVSVALARRGQDYVRIAYVAACVVDEDDRPVFTLEDVEKLAQLDWELILRLSDAAFRVERIRKADKAETEENFEEPQG